MIGSEPILVFLFDRKGGNVNRVCAAVPSRRPVVHSKPRCEDLVNLFACGHAAASLRARILTLQHASTSACTHHKANEQRTAAQFRFSFAMVRLDVQYQLQYLQHVHYTMGRVCCMHIFMLAWLVQHGPVGFCIESDPNANSAWKQVDDFSMDVDGGISEIEITAFGLFRRKNGNKRFCNRGGNGRMRSGDSNFCLTFTFCISNDTSGKFCEFVKPECSIISSIYLNFLIIEKQFAMSIVQRATEKKNLHITQFWRTFQLVNNYLF